MNHTYIHRALAGWNKYGKCRIDGERNSQPAPGPDRDVAERMACSVSQWTTAGLKASGNGGAQASTDLGPKNR